MNTLYYYWMRYTAAVMSATFFMANILFERMPFWMVIGALFGSLYLIHAVLPPFAFNILAFAYVAPALTFVGGAVYCALNPRHNGR